MEESIIGRTVRDVITGFIGVVTGRVVYITGCNQLLVQPRVKEGGEYVDSHWLDEDRCLLLPGVDQVSLAVKSAGPDKPAPIR